MRKLLSVLLSCLCVVSTGSLRAQTADAESLRAVLKKTAERYKSLITYVISAKTSYIIHEHGQSGVGDTKTQLSVGKSGAFRVEQESNGVPEVRISDGKATWKVLPKEKLWSRQEVAQSVGSDDDEEGMAQNTMGQDLFMQAQTSFVKRYTGLERYASVAQLEHDARLKLNGDKVDCKVVHIPGNDSDNRLFISATGGWVVRHVELVKHKDGSEVKMTTDYGSIDPEPPPAALFAFEPTKGARQVNDIFLPSERNLSLVGRRAADFTLTKLDGAAVHLAELQGKVVLLDFWATWCPPCRHELPTIEALSRKYKEKNVAVLGINDEDQKVARRYLEQHHPDLATLHDEKGKISRLYNTHAIPTVIVIDGSGNIVAHFIGERSEGELVAALKQAGMQ